MAALSNGIDVSRWQGDFDFPRAKAEGFDFVIIKGGGGDAGLYKDSKFERNYAAAKAAGMAAGAYWFSRALTVSEAETEADYFYENILSGKQFELPVYMDVENRNQLNVGKRLLTDIIKAFCTRLEQLGYWAGVYSPLSYFNDYMYDDELQQYAHWVAQWARNCSYPNKNVLGIWQYGGETNLLRSNKVAGVVCDQNQLFIPYTPDIKAAGLNGFPKANVTPETYWPPRKLQLGMEGNDVAALQALLIAHGYVCNVSGAYDFITEAEVAKFQKDKNIPATGIADGLTWEEVTML